MTALRDFLAREVEQHSYRWLAAKTGVSRGALEHIVKGQGTDLPKIETLQRVAIAYAKPLWEVQQMAGVNLDLPQTATESAQRLDQLLQQVPDLRAIVERLKTMWDVNPDYVQGMVIGLEATVSQSRAPPTTSQPLQE